MLFDTVNWQVGYSMCRKQFLFFFSFDGASKSSFWIFQCKWTARKIDIKHFLRVKKFFKLVFIGVKRDKTNLWQQKVGKIQEVSVIGRLKIFLSKGHHTGHQGWKKRFLGTDVPYELVRPSFSHSLTRSLQVVTFCAFGL